MTQIISYLPNWQVFMQAFFAFIIPLVIWKLFKQAPVHKEES
ncbi:hypothetical protein [Anaerobacillus alkalidiazotrophicus]|nr:hypothetical protein [Anaerobacillus alkalidiazotrophicus]